MENLGVYWTVAFGNHDTEAYSKYDRAQIADFYENSGFKYCLFKSGPENIDGYGNNVINIKNSKGEITQSIFTFDSHAYLNHDILGFGYNYDNIRESQVEWYRENIEKLTEYNKSVSNMENPVPKSTAFCGNISFNKRYVFALSLFLTNFIALQNVIGGVAYNTRSNLIFL